MLQDKKNRCSKPNDVHKFNSIQKRSLYIFDVLVSLDVIVKKLMENAMHNEEITNPPNFHFKILIYSKMAFNF